MTRHHQEARESIELNGTVYAVNDHVYVSSPWNASDDAPWLIGRIMEFIREPGTAGSSKKKKTPPVTQFKLAHYHRQRDLNSRHILDCRLLEASMTCDVFCISRLRGKCRVEFKNDRNTDEVDGWKTAPDTFYFYQVYGRFNHRHYDLISTQNIKNAPPEVIQFLRNNYSYVFAEPGMGSELSEERRGCVSCQKWTTGTDSVTCALCNAAYHFTCLNPPLFRKPERGHRWARGYQWACAPCSKKRQESIEEQALSIAKAATEESAATSTSNGIGGGTSGRSLRDKGKKKEVSVTAHVPAGNGSDGVLRTLNGWPFRYYGQYTEPASVLDPMDSPYLYTAPRIGSRFQATIPVHASRTDENYTLSFPPVARPVKVGKRSRDGTPVNPSSTLSSEVEVPRGGDETIDVISTPEQLENHQESTLDEYIRDATCHRAYRHVGVTLLDQALKTLVGSSSLEDARSKLSEQTVKSWGFTHWTEGDSHRMDVATAQLGDDLRSMLKLFPKKNQADITKHFYMFKGHKAPEVSAQQARVSASTSQSPDESSSILPTPSSKRPYTCVVCEVRCAPLWRRCPEALMAGATHSKKSICDECFVRWKKYGLQHVPVAEQEDNHRAKERKSRGSHAKASKATVSKTSHTASPLVGPLPQTLAPVLPPESLPSCPLPALPQAPPFLSTKPTLPSEFSPPQRVSPPRISPSYCLPHSPSQTLSPKTSLAPKPLSPPPSIAPEPLTSTVDLPLGSCTICKRLEPIASMARCTNCSLECHLGCLGLDSGANLASWKCLVCQNFDSLAVSKVLCCSLCQSKPRYLAPHEPFTALDVWKLSEYNSYVHMICAIWHAELTLGTNTDLSRVEGFASIPLSKRKRECIICHQAGVGVCTKCDECSNSIHVSCAWSAGYKFGFEILPQRKRRPRESDLVRYAEHNGLMEPRIWCPEHFPIADRVAYDVSDIDPFTQMTALQTFLQHQKDVSADPNLKIFRKARRLDSVLESVTKPKHTNPTASLWCKSLDLEDGYMVSALSLLPEPCEATSQDSVIDIGRGKLADQGLMDGSDAVEMPATRVRTKDKARHPGRPRTQGVPRTTIKSSDSKETNKVDAKSTISQDEPSLVDSPLEPMTQYKPSAPAPKSESALPRPLARSSLNSKPSKTRLKHGRPPNDLAEPNTRSDGSGLGNDEGFGRFPTDNSTNLEGAQTYDAIRASKESFNQATGVQSTMGINPKPSKARLKHGKLQNDSGEANGRSDGLVVGQEEGFGRSLTSNSTLEGARTSDQIHASPEPFSQGIEAISVSGANPKPHKPRHKHGKPQNDSGESHERRDGHGLSKNEGFGRSFTSNDASLEAPGQIRTAREAFDQASGAQPTAVNIAHASKNPEPIHKIPLMPTNPVPPLPQLQTASPSPLVKPPSKLRLTIKPTHPPLPSSRPPALSPMLVETPSQDDNHLLPAPAFPFHSQSSSSFPHPAHPPRPMSSSSSSSTPSSSSIPKMTRLPSINQLDVFHPSIPRLHPLTSVPPIPSPMYLPPISSVTQSRRPPTSTPLPPPPPLLSGLHHSPTPNLLPHPPAHFRFTAPLSTPPSFDAFARAAAATASKSNIKNVPSLNGGPNSSDTPIAPPSQ